MLFKLSFRNARRTFSDYLIYMITVSLAISMEFALNRILFIDEIYEMSNVAVGFNYMLIAASLFMMAVVALMIKYMVKFIVDKRSNEFGLYMLMGIEQKNIKRIFWIEQIYLCIASLGLGVLFGLLLGEILKIIIYNFMNFKYSFELIGFGKSLTVTVIVTALAYLFSYIFSFRLFKRNKIIDWIKSDRINEVEKHQNPKIQIIKLSLSFIILVVGLFTLNHAFSEELNMAFFPLAVLLILIGIYEISSSSVVLFNGALLRDNNFTKRVLPVRFIGGKVKTMSMQLGTLSILFVLSLTLLSMGIIFANYYKGFEDEYGKFDLIYRMEEKDEEYINGIEEIVGGFGKNEKTTLKVYKTPPSEIYKIVYSHLSREEVEEYGEEILLSLSDYNKLRLAAGYDEVSLKENEFIIQTYFQMQNLKKDVSLKDYEINGEKYSLKAIIDEPMNTIDINSYYIVIEDRELNDLKADNEIYLWKIEDYDYIKLHDRLLSYAIGVNKETREVYDLNGRSIELSWNISIAQQNLNEYLVSLTGSALALLLIGLIFALVMCTVLSMNLLSGVKTYKRRYELLSKLGVPKGEIRKLIWQQILILFLFPLILGLPISIVTVMIINKIFSSVMTLGYIILNLLLTVLVFILIYMIYMVATYKTYEAAVEN
ncbi:FtsX-like permease family protein [Anaerosphaera multitolerans]|uniref:FtsX-like permease family protein n=1 Tax=Anaerosphaera multitolerans TaxID=2487351 RepID=A0A437S5V1_9FIRM|nr:FtsX-like permease family protein [Anaerosphaera multitolerans]RVU54379.1 FtsX-like permease family protein [Anaerosphaera multitolerans]